MSRLVTLVLSLWLALGVTAHGAVAASTAPRRVLVVYTSGRLLPASVVADRALRASLDQSASPVELYAEFLDTSHFQGQGYESTVKTYLKEKYAGLPPEVLIGAGEGAFDFLLRARAELFPGAPLVYLGVSREQVEERTPLPDDVRGVPVVYDGAGTVAQALLWQPQTRRIVAVTGTSPWDRAWDASLRRDLARFETSASVEHWTGLPWRELEARLAELDAGAIVFSPGFFADGDGRPITPKSAVERIVRASPVAVYGPYDTFIGTGVVGGLMPSFGAAGEDAGTITKALLAGAPAASLDLGAFVPARPQLDWRQARRFGIRAADVSPDTIVHFREPTFWQEYRGYALGFLGVIALQGTLIAALLVERRRRRAGERRIALATDAAGLSLWDWDGEAISSRPPFDTVHPADRAALEQSIRVALERHEPLNVEYRSVVPGGEPRWFAAYGRREPGTERLLGVARDVTERKRAELQAESDRGALRHVARVSMLGQLSASIAHQLNQPLAAIGGNAEAALTLLEREPPDLAELRAICTDIVSEDQRAAEIIRRLRALFRRGEPRLAALDPNELVTETLELARSELVARQVIASAELEPGLPPVRGDRVQLQQLLLNLIVNAADAMSATEGRARELTIRTEKVTTGVCVRVADRGPGIPAEARERLFEPFWTTKSDGMGIGLAICRSIVEAHGGRLTVANRPGGGAEFSFVVPENPP